MLYKHLKLFNITFLIIRTHTLDYCFSQHRYMDMLQVNNTYVLNTSTREFTMNFELQFDSRYACASAHSNNSGPTYQRHCHYNYEMMKPWTSSMKR